jgi:hypothetical protein
MRRRSGAVAHFAVFLGEAVEDHHDVVEADLVGPTPASRPSSGAFESVGSVWPTVVIAVPALAGLVSTL